jgi:hypothetical protein
MSYTDYHFGDRLMDLRVQEERQQAELRGLQREAAKAHPDWLSRQRCRLLCQVGSLFVSLGVRLLRAGLPQPLPLGEQMPIE